MEVSQAWRSVGGWCRAAQIQLFAPLGPEDRELLVLDAIPSADVPSADAQYKALLHQGSISPLLYASHKHETPKNLFHVEINAAFPHTRSLALQQYFFGYPCRGDSTSPADAQNPAGSGNKPTFFLKPKKVEKLLLLHFHVRNQRGPALRIFAIFCVGSVLMGKLPLRLTLGLSTASQMSLPQDDGLARPGQTIFSCLTILGDAGENSCCCCFWSLWPNVQGCQNPCAIAFLRLSGACRNYRLVGLLPLVFSSLRELVF